MNLILVLLLSPLFFALGNIIDSYLIAKYGGQENHGNILGLLVISSFFSVFVICAALMLGWNQLSLVSGGSAFILICAGILTSISVLSYLYALQEDHPTAVVVWWQTIPFFTYVLSFIFLGERITSIQVIGGIIVIIGSLVVGISDIKNLSLKTIFNKKIIILMTIASLLYSIVSVIFKTQALGENLYWVSSLYENIGILFAGGLLFTFFKKSRVRFYEFITIKKVPLLALNSLNELLFIGATLIAQFVTLEIPLVIGSVIGGVTPIFVFIFSLVFVRFFPGKIIDMSLSRVEIIKNLFGIALTIFGLVLLK